jgi:hypothetical protein
VIRRAASVFAKKREKNALWPVVAIETASTLKEASVRRFMGAS